MVAIFIDESGQFTSSTRFSAIAALTLPHNRLRRTRHKLQFLTESWPKIDGELKGRQLSTRHIEALVDVLFRQHAILHCIVTSVGADDDVELKAHKDQQCEMMTRNLTSEHHPELVAQVRALRQTLENMPIQLYTQFVSQTHLLCAVIEDVPIYYSQRQPRELGLFEWFVDAKDKNVTAQENWWRTTLGPMIQSRSRRQPFGRVDDDSAFNYTYFDKAYDLEVDAPSPSGARRAIGTDIGKLVTKRLSFINSKSDILIQAADVLVRSTRRVLSEDDQCDPRMIDALGRLQLIRRRDRVLQSMQFILLAGEGHDLTHAEKVNQRMTRAGRSMLLPANRT
jgi:hypothetical protein